MGRSISEIHPFIIEGRGHTSITNVEAFSGPNLAISTLGESSDYLLVRGEDRATITLFGCRMRNYSAAEPITILNSEARVQAVACVDKEERLFNRTWNDQ